MKWLVRVGLIAFISANSKIFWRGGISILIIFICNFFYNKYEALLLATNPDKLFIPLYIFTSVTLVLIIWILFSLRSISSFSQSKKVDQIKKSYRDKPPSLSDLADITKHPTLKTKADRILDK